MTKLAPEWVRTSDPVIRSPERYRWTTAPAPKGSFMCTQPYTVLHTATPLINHSGTTGIYPHRSNQTTQDSNPGPSDHKSHNLPYKPIYKSTSCKVYSEPNWLKLHKPLYTSRYKMLYYFKTKFPVCCHLSKSTEGYQVHIQYKLYLVTFGNDMTNRTKINRTMKSLFNSVQQWHNFRGLK